MRISDWSSDVCSSDLTVAPPSGNRRLRHLQQESRAVFDRSTVGVGPLVGPVLQKLFRQVAVGAVDLDAVEDGSESELGAGAELFDYGGDLAQLEGPRKGKGGLAVHRVRLAVGADG